MDLLKDPENQPQIALTPDEALSLGRFIAEVTSARSEDEIYVTLAQHLNMLLPNDRTSVTLLNEMGDGLDIFALQGPAGVMPVGKTVPLENCIAGEAFLEQKAQLTLINADTPQVDGRALYAAGLGACMNVALTVRDMSIGTLNCAAENADQYSPHSIELLSLIGRLISTNIERQRLLEQRSEAVVRYRTYAEQLETLNCTAQQVVGTSSERDLLNIIAAAIQEILPAQRASYATYDPDSERFSVIRLSGLKALEGKAILPRQNTALSKVWHENRSLYVENLAQSHFAEHIKLTEAGLRSGWSIPVRCADKVISILNVATDQRVSDVKRLTRILETLAAFIGTNIERITAQKQVVYHANYDELTGLPNRQRFRSVLTEMCRHCQKTPFALLFIDLDRFKQVNDSLGHKMGDQLLKKVGNRLQTVVRENDLVARLGGDEFVVLLQGTEISDTAKHTAQRIITSLSIPFSLGEHRAFIGASIGISLAPEHATLTSDIIKFADIAMYQAKALGRNLYQFYNGQQSAHIAYHHKLQQTLHSAIDNNELELLFQPQLEGRQVVAMEAVTYWHHPEIGPINQNDVMRAAEDGGAMEAITQWILDQSLLAIKQLREILPDLYVAVSLSADDCQPFEELLITVQQALQKHQLPGDALELEITENTYLHDTDATHRLFRAFKAMGIRLAIDGFGTGFSSLARLYQLPLDTLKIDPSFTQGLDNDDTRRGIVSGIITIANSLDIDCLAEGIESAIQVPQLEQLGCKRFQGDLFCRPISADAFRQHLQNGITDSLPC